MKSKTKKPNIVLYISDSLRQDFVGVYNPSRLRLTPNLNALANESVVFENAYAAASWTRPSLFSMLTGQYPGALGVHSVFSPYPKDIPSLPRLLKANGYYTIAVGSGPLDAWAPSVREDFDSYIFVDWLDSSGLYRGVSELILLNLQQIHLPSNQPVFILILCTDTHDPYFNRWKPQNNLLITAQELHLYRNKVSTLKSLYEDMVHYTDHFIGALLHTFRSQLDYANTIFIFTSDHGEGFKEHGFLSHRGVVFQEMIRVPLIIKFPYVRYKHLHVRNNVSLVDLFPTTLELAEINWHNRIDGKSLLGSFKPVNKEVRTIIAECSYQYDESRISFTLIKGTYKIIFDIYNTIYDISGKNNNHRDCREQSLYLLKNFARRFKSLSSKQLIGSVIGAWEKRKLWHKWLKQMPLLYDIKNDPYEQSPIELGNARIRFDEFEAEKTRILENFQFRKSKLKFEEISKKLSQGEKEEIEKRLQDLGYL